MPGVRAWTGWVRSTGLFGRVPGPETPEVATGIVSDLDFDRRCAMKQMASMFRRACPDLSSTTDLVVAEEDLVVERRTARGTQTGELMGIAATGKQFEMSETRILRIVLPPDPSPSGVYYPFSPPTADSRQ